MESNNRDAKNQLLRESAKTSREDTVRPSISWKYRYRVLQDDNQFQNGCARLQSSNVRFFSGSIPDPTCICIWRMHLHNDVILIFMVLYLIVCCQKLLSTSHSTRTNAGDDERKLSVDWLHRHNAYVIHPNGDEQHAGDVSITHIFQVAASYFYCFKPDPRVIFFQWNPLKPATISNYFTSIEF